MDAGGSPLLVYSEILRERVGEEALGDDFCVVLGMHYGKPSIETALKKFQKAQCHQLIVLPLFPQYSTSTTESALEEVRAKNSFKEMTLIDYFFEEPHYIDSITTLIHENLNKFKPDYFLFSYHGLPERHLVKNGCQSATCNRKNNCSPISNSNENCYRSQCFETSRLIAQKLNLTDQQYGVALQSRLGCAKWIEPYTDKYLIELSKKRIKKLMVVCSSFTVNCLETLEEIGICARSQWQRLGGETLKVIPSLNAHPQWVTAIVKIAKKSLYLF